VCFEAAFRQAGRPFKAVITGSRLDSVTEAVAQQQRCLVKLHGDALERSDRILTSTEYERYYGEGKPLQPLLLDILRRPMLFVGCSLTSDRPLAALQELHRQSSRTMHFAVLELPEQTDQAVEREKALAGCKVLPIWFPPGAFDAIEGILEHLAREGEPQESEPADLDNGSGPQQDPNTKEPVRRPVETLSPVRIGSLAAALPANPRVVSGLTPIVGGVFGINCLALLLAKAFEGYRWIDTRHASEMFASAVGFSLLGAILLVLMLARTLNQHIVLSFIRAFVLLTVFYDVCAGMSLVLGHGSIVHRLSVVAVLLLGIFVLVRGGLIPYFWRERRWLDIMLEAVPVLLFIGGVAWAAERMMML
jgi:hypothetical protein